MTTEIHPVIDWGNPPIPSSIKTLMNECPKYSQYYTNCKYQPRLYYEWLTHHQTFMVMEEGLSDSNLRRVKTLIRGKVRNNSSLAKKYHKDETDWTFENWVEAYKSLDIPRIN